MRELFERMCFWRRHIDENADLFGHWHCIKDAKGNYMQRSLYPSKDSAEDAMPHSWWNENPSAKVVCVKIVEVERTNGGAG